MRPVNLIPPEDRRGDKAPARTGPLAYVLVGVLAVALFAVTAVVLTTNQISDHKAEKAELESQLASAQAQAQRFSSFAEFATLQQARQETVTTLAQSRFDWERVLRELAIVIPDDVWLNGLSASVSPDAEAVSDTSSAGSSSAVTPENVQGPSLKIQGCASGHEAVARFLAALRDIDGVTRVSVLSSDKPETSTGGAETEQTATGACSTRDFISQFQVIAAFDAAATPAGTAAPAPPPSAATPPASPAPATSTEGEATASAADQSQVTDSQQQLDQQKQSSGQQTQRGRKAVDTFIPGTGTAP